MCFFDRAKLSNVGYSSKTKTKFELKYMFVGCGSCDFDHWGINIM